MKKILILVALSLFFIGMQAQVKSVSEYQVDKVGMLPPVEVYARVITIDDVAEKFCVLQTTNSANIKIVVALNELELETMLRKIDEIKVGNMDLTSDYFEKSYTIVTSSSNSVEIGYYIRTKMDATKGQQWFIKIKDGIYEGITSSSLNDIYKTLGKARAKLQSL